MFFFSERKNTRRAARFVKRTNAKGVRKSKSYLKKRRNRKTVSGGEN